MAKEMTDKEYEDALNARFEIIDSKTIEDTSGYDTYTLYYDVANDYYFTIYGDVDVYGPELDWTVDDIESNCDMGFESNEKEAREWFDNYDPLEDLDESEHLILNEEGDEAIAITDSEEAYRGAKESITPDQIASFIEMETDAISRYRSDINCMEEEGYQVSDAIMNVLEDIIITHHSIVGQLQAIRDAIAPEEAKIVSRSAKKTASKLKLDNNEAEVNEEILNELDESSFGPCKEVIEYLRGSYPKGTRVQLISMNDPQAPRPGTRGTIVGVDDMGTLHVEWDNGSTLGVVYGEDYIKKVANESMKRIRKI